MYTLTLGPPTRHRLDLELDDQLGDGTTQQVNGIQTR